MTLFSGAAEGTWVRRPGLRIGAIASLLFLLIGFVSIAWIPYPVESIDVGAAMQAPSPVHWLGTDHLGRDLVSMLMKGTLTSFVVAVVALAVGAIIGLPLGLAAAAWGGPAEWAILRVGDFLVAFPALIISILITTVFGPSAINTMIAVGIFNVPALARVARDSALRLKGLDYVAASRLAGLGPFEIARRHILPSMAGPVAAQAVTQLGLGILAEASLSYVGLGALPPATSLGLMLRDAQTYALLNPSLVLVPGIAIILIVLALNLTADGLRDLADPKLGSGGKP